MSIDNINVIHQKRWLDIKKIDKVEKTTKSALACQTK
jgi:hypothetical protein